MMTQDINNCSILFLSCDKYINILNQCINLVLDKWQDCPFKMYSLTETANVDHCISLHSDSQLWSKRLISALKTIDTPYVFIILDDLWPEKTIDTKLILNYLKEMQNDPYIANIGFSKMPGCKAKNVVIDCGIRNKKPWSLVNFQIGLWNKEALLKFLKENENPWDAEVLGSIRTRLYPKYKFYCLLDDAKTPYKYGKGWLVVRGKWNLPEVNRLEHELQIKINLGDRAVDDFSKGIKLSFAKRVSIHLRVWLYKIKIGLIKLFGGSEK